VPKRQKFTFATRIWFLGRVAYMLHHTDNYYINSALHPSGVASSTSFGWGKCGNVTSAGWQVTLCNPMWHVGSRSGVATLRTAIHLLLTYLLTVARSVVSLCVEQPLTRAKTAELIDMPVERWLIWSDIRSVVKVDRRIRWHYTTTSTILRLRIGARLTRYRNCKFHNGLVPAHLPLYTIRYEMLF